MSSGGGVNERVGVHESAEEVASKVDCVGGSYILDNTIKHKKGRELFRRRSLHPVSFSAHNKKLPGHVTEPSRLPYRFDVVLKRLRDILSVFCVLLGDDGEITDLVAVVVLQISQ